MRASFRSLTLVFLLTLILPFSQPDVSLLPPIGPEVMPPHPALWQRIERGEVKLPPYLANPTLARSRGIDAPKGAAKVYLGPIKILAVLVDFNDEVRTVQASFFDNLIFAAPVSSRGSVRDYFNEISYGQVDIVTVNLPSSLGWKRAPSNSSYYTNDQSCLGDYPQNCQKLAEDIVDAINGAVNFANYDNDGDGTADPILLIHAGSGAEFSGRVNDIWSHSWFLNNTRTYDGKVISPYIIMPEYWLAVGANTSDMTIGVFAHEMGHGFWNLPDLYDRDSPPNSSGIGNWSLMGHGAWNGTNGNAPAWPDAWSRVHMGFVTPTEINSSVTAKSIPRAYNNPSPAQTVLKLRSLALGDQEYFLLENRQRVAGSYDEYLPAAGLLIWHIDEAMQSHTLQNDHECTLWPNWLCDDTQHYLVALEQADGLRQLEYGSNRGDTGDPFPGASTNRTWSMTTNPESSSWYGSVSLNSCLSVTNISNAGATMTANLNTCGIPTNLTATPVSQTQINLSWTDTSSIETGFKLEQSSNGTSDWTEIATVEADVTTYPNSSLTCDTTYYYRVRAYARSDSGYSNIASATTIGDTAAPVGSLAINDNDLYAPSTNVILTLSATDSGMCISGVNRMRLSNNGTAWSSWESYTTTKLWSLASGEGSKTVYVQYRDTAGNTSPIYSDGIIVDTTPPSSSVIAPTDLITSSRFTVQWAGSDSRSGIKNYDLQSQENGGDWINWQTNTTATSALFHGAQDGFSYCFRSRAEDQAGNLESYPVDSDVCATVDLIQPDLVISSTILSSDSICLGDPVTLYATVYNQGDGPAGAHYLYYYNDATTADYNNYIGYGYLNSLDVASGSDQSYTFTPSTTDIRYIKIQADPTNWVTENDENNNGGYAMLTVNSDTSSPTGSISINSEATYATSTGVTLTLFANDSGMCASGVSQMRFSNDGSLWSSWENYNTSKSWTLSNGDGQKTVHVQYRDPRGNISSAQNDTIILDTAAPTSIVYDLPNYSTSSNFIVSWTGDDEGSGVACYDIEVKINTGEWSAWLNCVTSTEAAYSGSSGNRYYFRSRAKDNVDRWENYPANYDDSTLVDTLPPTSSVFAPAGLVSSRSFVVSWSGSDSHSGLKHYDVQYKDDKGSWVDWQVDTTTTSHLFTHAQDGQTYCFQSRAEDHAGHLETYPDGEGDTCVTVQLPDGPDLTVVDLSASAVDVCPGDQISFTTVEYNQGKNSSSDHQLSYYEGSHPNDFSHYLGYSQISGLAADATANHLYQHAFNTGGARYFLVKADGNDTIIEADESNNVSYLVIMVNSGVTTPTGSIAINHHAIYATDPNVILSLSALDHDACDQVGLQMRFSQDGQNWSNWESYAPIKTITLTGTQTQSVYVQYRDRAGHLSQAYHDEIIVDVTAPSSSVYALAGVNSSGSFSIFWTGSDDTSQVACYDVQVKANASSWSTWQSCTAATTGLYNGQPDETYYFRSRAKDHAGNWESYPVNPEYDTFITVATGQGKNIYLPTVIK